MLRPEIVSCNVIGGWKILPRKQSMLMKPKELAKHHQTLSSQLGSGHETTIEDTHHQRSKVSEDCSSLPAFSSRQSSKPGIPVLLLG